MAIAIQSGMSFTSTWHHGLPSPFQALSSWFAGGDKAPCPNPSRLKVLRVFEAGTSPACAGRMVISGRMADVCAELNRMG